MPRKSPKQCNTIGCPELTYDVYCDKHSKDRHKEYKRYRDDKREQSFYSSTEWIKLRNYKRMINPLCEDCLHEDKLTPVAVIDHIVELKDDNGWSLRLTLS
jgi:5-methylcytosine-specific restriction protein A